MHYSIRRFWRYNFKPTIPSFMMTTITQIDHCARCSKASSFVWFRPEEQQTQRILAYYKQHLFRLFRKNGLIMAYMKDEDLMTFFPGKRPTCESCTVKNIDVLFNSQVFSLLEKYTFSSFSRLMYKQYEECVEDEETFFLTVHGLHLAETLSIFVYKSIMPRYFMVGDLPHLRLEDFRHPYVNSPRIYLRPVNYQFFSAAEFLYSLKLNFMATSDSHVYSTLFLQHMGMTGYFFCPSQYRIIPQTVEFKTPPKQRKPPPFSRLLPDKERKARLFAKEKKKKHTMSKRVDRDSKFGKIEPQFLNGLFGVTAGLDEPSREIFQKVIDMVDGSDLSKSLTHHAFGIAAVVVTIGSTIHSIYTHDKTSCVIAISSATVTAGYCGFLNIPTLSDIMSRVISISTNILARLNDEGIEPQMDFMCDLQSVSTLLSTILMSWSSFDSINMSSLNKLPGLLFTKLSAFDRANKSLVEIFRGVVSVIEWAFNYISTRLCGGVPMRFLDSESKDYDNFCDRAMDIHYRLSKSDFEFSTLNHNELVSVITSGKSIAVSLKRGSSPGILSLLLTEIRKLEKIEEKFSAANLGRDSTRVEPVALMLLGGSGVGKSTSLDHFKNAFLARILPDGRPYEKFINSSSNVVYNRTKGSQYHSGYDDSKLVTVFDELGQEIDVPGSATNSYLDVIQAINIHPWVLDMAEIERKGVTHFHSELVIATTNRKQYDLNSIYCSEAFTRRWDFPMVVYPAEEYCTDETIPLDLFNKKIDPEKLPRDDDGVSIVSPQIVSRYVRWDFKKQAPIGRVYTFNELLDEMIALHKKKHAWHSANVRCVKNTRDEQRSIFLEEIEPQTVPLNLSQKYANVTDDDFQVEFVGEDPDLVNAIHEILHDFDLNQIPTQAAFAMAMRISSLNMQSMHEKNLTGSWRIDVSRCAKVFGQRFLEELFSEDIHFRDFSNFDFNDLESSTCRLYLRYARDTLFPKSFTSYETIKLHLHDYYTQFVESSFFKYVKAFAAFSGIATIFFGCWRVYKSLTAPTAEIELIEGEDISVDFTSDTLVDDQSVHLKQKHRTRSKQQGKQPSSKDMRGIVPQMASECDPNGFQIMKKFTVRNVFGIMQNHKDGPRHLGFGIGICDRCAIIPKHFLTQIYYSSMEDERILKENLIIQIGTNLGATTARQFTIPIKHLLANQTDEGFGDNDVVMVKFPNFVPPFANIVKYFQTEDFFRKTSRFNYLLLAPNGYDREHFSGVANILKTPISIHSDTTGSYDIAHAIAYAAPTTLGDCGMLLCILNKGEQQKKFVGLHVSGAPSVGRGFSAPVSQEALNAALNYFGDELVLMDPELDIIAQTDTMLSEGQYLEEYDIPTYERGSRTKIFPSRLHGKWGPALTKPCHLVPRTIKGEYKDPWRAAYAKYCTPALTEDISDEVNIVRDELYDFLVCKSMLNVNARLLSFDEAVAGIEGEPLYKGISRSTSAGIGEESPPGYPGKTWLFGSGNEYDLTSEQYLEFKDKYLKILDKIKDGFRPEFRFKDCLKDERKPIDKVDAFKTRLFCVSPVGLLVLFRMYFGSFSLWFQSNKIDNGGAVGVNPYSRDWNYIVQILGEMSHPEERGFGAGDYSRYDGSEKPIIHWAILDIIQMWYCDGKENARVRSILWLELVNSKHVHAGLHYTWVSSLPSGFPLTTIVNILYNQFAFRLCWNDVTRDTPGINYYDDHVRAIFMGDDNLFSVSPEYRKKFHEGVLHERMKRFGLTYTDSSKGNVFEGLKPLREVDFEKRTFVFDPVEQAFIAPLELAVVLEIPYWTTEGNATISSDEIVLQNVENSLMELSLHPREVFDKYAPEMIRNLKDEYDYSPRRSTYDSNRRFVLNVEYSY